MIATLDEKGGVVLPPEYLEKLRLKPGDSVNVTLENNEIRIKKNWSEAVKRVQATVRQYVPEGRCLSEELIKERREEAEREYGSDSKPVIFLKIGLVR